MYLFNCQLMFCLCQRTVILEYQALSSVSYTWFVFGKEMCSYLRSRSQSVGVTSCLLHGISTFLAVVQASASSGVLPSESGTLMGNPVCRRLRVPSGKPHSCESQGSAGVLLASCVWPCTSRARAEKQLSLCGHGDQAGLFLWLSSGGGVCRWRRGTSFPLQSWKFPNRNVLYSVINFRAPMGGIIWVT